MGSADGAGPLVQDGWLHLAPSEPPVLPPEMALGAGHAAVDGGLAAAEKLGLNMAVANVLSLAPREEKDGGVQQLEVTSRMDGAARPAR